MIWLGLPAVLMLVITLTSNYPSRERSQAQVDYWVHLIQGRILYESGAIPTEDKLTYTLIGQPVHDQNWLAQAGMYAVLRLGGTRLFLFLDTWLLAAMMSALLAVAYSRADRQAVVASLSMILGVFLVANFVRIRPQVASILLFGFELALLWTWRTPRWSPLAMIGALQLLWTNSHGAFPMGIVLPGVFWVGESLSHVRQLGPSAAWREPQALRFLLATVLALAVSFINPRPLETVSYVFENMQRSQEREITEWQPVTVTTGFGLFYTATVILAGATLLFSPRPKTATDWLLYFVFAFAGFRAVRMIVWWGLIFGPLIAPHLLACGQALRRRFLTETASETQEFQSPWIDGTLVAGLLVMALSANPWAVPYHPFFQAISAYAHDPAKGPYDVTVDQRFGPDDPLPVVHAIQGLRMQGRAFTLMEYAGYFSWHLYPKWLFSMDARVDQFSNAQWEEYQSIRKGHETALASLDRDRVDLVIWPVKDLIGDVVQKGKGWGETVLTDEEIAERWNALPNRLAASGRWEVVYTDDDFKLWRRKAPLAPSTPLAPLTP